MNPILPQLCAGRLVPAFPSRCRRIMLAAVLLLFPLTSHGGSATWKAAPTNGSWNTASNWTPATVPNGFADTATFNTSSVLSISLSQTMDLDGMVFNASANAFTFTSGAGSTLSLAGTVSRTIRRTRRVSSRPWMSVATARF